MGGHRKPRADKADLARQAIKYLVQTDLVLKWDFPEADQPPEEIRHLLTSYLADGEIERTTSSLLCDYLVGRLREDHLSMGKRSPPGQGHAPWSRRAACRVVCGDGDDD